MFEPGLLLHDLYLTTPSEFDVQAFLEELDSPLADYELEGVLVSDLVAQAATANQMDPRVLLTKLQVEQSLLTSEPTPEKLDWAMGYGRTDTVDFEEYRDFATQLNMAAQALKGYLDPDHPFSVVELVGEKMAVADGVVVPQNLATAALYRYTPWIGDKSFAGHDPPFGNTLFFQVWLELFGFDSRFPPLSGNGWRVIVPPDNWQQPIPLPSGAVEPVLEIARRLDLVVTTAPLNRKLYLGLPQLEQPDPPEEPGLEYPSGVWLPLVEEPDQAERYRPADPDVAAPLVELTDVAVSDHFRLAEFAPRDSSYRYVRLLPELVELLEAIREAIGGHPITINSGYRPPAYNAEVGGVPMSTHIDGLAADLSTPHVPLQRLWEVADQLVGDQGGLGYYPASQFVHVDLRGHRARWTG